MIYPLGPIHKVDPDTEEVTLGEAVRSNMDSVRFFPYPFEWEGKLYVLNGFDLAGTIHYTPYPIHYTLYTIPYTPYPISHTLYTIPYTLYTIPIPYSLYTTHYPYSL
jgi:hypothetical protein